MKEGSELYRRKIESHTVTHKGLTVFRVLWKAEKGVRGRGGVSACSVGMGIMMMVVVIVVICGGIVI